MDLTSLQITCKWFYPIHLAYSSLQTSHSCPGVFHVRAPPPLVIWQTSPFQYSMKLQSRRYIFYYYFRLNKQMLKYTSVCQFLCMERPKSPTSEPKTVSVKWKFWVFTYQQSVKNVSPNSLFIQAKGRHKNKRDCVFHCIFNQCNHNYRWYVQV